MDGIEITVTGLDEARRKLYSYSQQLGDKVIMLALADTARIVRDRIKAGAPFRTGRLRKAVIVKRSKIHSSRRSDNSLGVFVALRLGKGKKDPKDGFYGRWLERGWNVRGKSRSGSAGRSTITAAFGSRSGRKSLPGSRNVPPTYFMSKAFEASRSAVISSFTAKIELAANRIASRLGIR